MVLRVLAVISIVLGLSGLVPPWLAWTLAGLAVAGIIVDLALTIRTASRTRVPTGGDALVGRTAVARTPLAPEGFVLVQGERWLAELEEGEAAAGQQVRIIAANGLRLTVRFIA